VKGGEKAAITAISCTLLMQQCKIQDNFGHGIFGLEVQGFLFQCQITRCQAKAISLLGTSLLCINNCDIIDNAKGACAVDVEDDISLIASVSCRTDQATQFKLNQCNKNVTAKCNRSSRNVVMVSGSGSVSGSLSLADPNAISSPRSPRLADRGQGTAGTIVSSSSSLSVISLP
jgi:hypothetical protein